MQTQAWSDVDDLAKLTDVPVAQGIFLKAMASVHAGTFVSIIDEAANEITNLTGRLTAVKERKDQQFQHHGLSLRVACKPRNTFVDYHGMRYLIQVKSFLEEFEVNVQEARRAFQSKKGSVFFFAKRT